MFNFFIVAINAIGVGVSFITNLLKHPIFIKTAFVGVFFSLLLFTIDFMLSLTVVNMGLEAFDIARYLGVSKAIEVFFSLAITSYASNQMLTYFKNF